MPNIGYARRKRWRRSAEERARAALEAAASQTERDDVRAAVTKLLSVMKDRN